MFGWRQRQFGRRHPLFDRCQRVSERRQHQSGACQGSSGERQLPSGQCQPTFGDCPSSSRRCQRPSGRGQAPSVHCQRAFGDCQRQFSDCKTYSRAGLYISQAVSSSGDEVFPVTRPPGLHLTQVEEPQQASDSPKPCLEGNGALGLRRVDYRRKDKRARHRFVERVQRGPLHYLGSRATRPQCSRNTESPAARPTPAMSARVLNSFPEVRPAACTS